LNLPLLLRKLVPNVATIAMLAYPGTPDTEAERRQVQAAAHACCSRMLARWAWRASFQNGSVDVPLRALARLAQEQEPGV